MNKQIYKEVFSYWKKECEAGRIKVPFIQWLVEYIHKDLFIEENKYDRGFRDGDQGTYNP